VKSESRPSCLSVAILFAVSLAGIPLPTINLEALRLLNSAVPVAFQQFEKSTPDQNPGKPDLSAKSPRRADSSFAERTRDQSAKQGPTRDLLQQAPINPGFASKLDLCSEFTKPDSLVIRSMGTPKNHRSPPA
jgi:hypothetical protein